MIKFVKPKRRRVLWSLVAVVLVSCVLTGIAVFVEFLVNHEGSEPVSGGEVARLAILCLTLWGPMYLVIAWPFSVPLIGGLTALVAYTRVDDPEDAAVADDAE